MTIKRGLQRLWAFVSVLFLALIVFNDLLLEMRFFVVGALFVWWVIYWVVEGFFSDSGVETGLLKETKGDEDDW